MSTFPTRALYSNQATWPWSFQLCLYSLMNINTCPVPRKIETVILGIYKSTTGQYNRFSLGAVPPVLLAKVAMVFSIVYVYGYE